MRPKPTLLLGGSRDGVRLGGLETLNGGKGFGVVDLVVVVVVLVVVVVVVSGPHVRSENKRKRDSKRATHFFANANRYLVVIRKCKSKKKLLRSQGLNFPKCLNEFT